MESGTIGITRVRNEALIIADTLRHYLEHCERVLLYDDCSTDDTVEIAEDFDRVTVIRGDEWRANRVAENTRHRALLLDHAISIGADWCLCFDADERLVGDLPDLTADGYRFRLFDGYLTAELQEPYTEGDLADLPRLWGPEYRDIVMLFRADRARYDAPGQRQPKVRGRIETADVFVKHFGKCLSVEHWEETCRYYGDHFPEPFRSKWRARRGKAIHTLSDFGRDLKTWDDLMQSPQTWTRLA